MSGIRDSDSSSVLKSLESFAYGVFACVSVKNRSRICYCFTSEDIFVYSVEYIHMIIKFDIISDYI